jgi:hypothetical protein
MKWVVLVVVVILAAPTIANRLSALDPDKAENADDAGGHRTGQKRRGFVYRAVRRFGPRAVFLTFVLFVIILAVLAYLLVRRI